MNNTWRVTSKAPLLRSNLYLQQIRGNQLIIGNYLEQDGASVKCQSEQRHYLNLVWDYK